MQSNGLVVTWQLLQPKYTVAMAESWTNILKISTDSMFTLHAW